MKWKSSTRRNLFCAQWVFETEWELCGRFHLFHIFLTKISHTWKVFLNPDRRGKVFLSPFSKENVLKIFRFGSQLNNAFPPFLNQEEESRKSSIRIRSFRSPNSTPCWQINDQKINFSSRLSRPSVWCFFWVFVCSLTRHKIYVNLLLLSQQTRSMRRAHRWYSQEFLEPHRKQKKERKTYKVKLVTFLLKRERKKNLLLIRELENSASADS